MGFWHRISSRIRFLWGSTNQHGVHSPFIYAYVTRCLYNPKRYDKAVVQDIWLRTKAYFESDEATHYDMVYWDISNFIACELPSLEKNFHNDSVLVLAHPYTSPAHTALWESIRNAAHTTVTVDLYYCAVVFFRKEQAPQHFKIRI